MLSLVKLYQIHFDNSIPEIQDKIEEIDLDFLTEDLPKVLSSMKHGTQRIQEIILSLRRFSRHDEAEVKKVDIHEGIDSTLTILEHRLQAIGKQQKISVVKNYGNLPQIECYAGKMNQVFMNILSNAIDALNEMRENPQYFHIIPIISIQTEVLSHERIAIRITDNGLGIPPAIQERLFEPFFTTKPAGKGTGLGLSISYQIVTEKHHGSLSCISSLNQGAEFIIQIPIYQPELIDKPGSIHT